MTESAGDARPFAAARLDEIDRRGNWIPIRRHFGIASFGVNAWTGDDGDEVIGPHEERQSGHEELYVVVSGRAEFTIAGETLRAGPGSYVAAPAGVTHGFRNAGGVELRMLNVHAPNTGFAEWLRGASAAEGPAS